jgi:hypothetical protein
MMILMVNVVVFWGILLVVSVDDWGRLVEGCHRERAVSVERTLFEGSVCIDGR